jgi:hypothetical protein
MAPVAWNLYSRLAILFVLAARGVEARIVKLRGCGCSGAVLIHVCVCVLWRAHGCVGVCLCACVRLFEWLQVRDLPATGL